MTKEIYSYEQKINEEFIASLNPCSDRHENYLEHYPEKEFTLEEFILLDKITYSDKKWVIWNNFLSILDKRKLACVFARHVLYIFEAKYPDDKRPRLALECAENENSTKKERIAAAADAARAAADAAYADAAYADAAYAAYAAADAAYADADARADERQFQLEQMVIVIKERNK